MKTIFFLTKISNFIIEATRILTNFIIEATRILTNFIIEATGILTNSKGIFIFPA